MSIENPILFAITMLQDYKGDLARRDFPDNDEGDHQQRVNESKRASVDAAIAGLRNASGQAQGVVMPDERASFEKWGETLFYTACFERHGNDEYAGRGLQGAWLGWQARAAMTEPDSEKVDANMALPCDIKLPGGMMIGKGCKLSTLLLSFRNRGDDVPWRQRFSVPVPYDPALLSISPVPAADADPCPKCIPGTVCRTPKCGRLRAQHQPIGIDSEGGSHD